MTIKGNIGNLVIDLDAVSTDTTIFDFDNRIAVTAFSLHNTEASDREVFFFESPDTTSGSGKRIASHVLGAGESIDVGEIIGQGYESNMNIIAVQQTAGAASGDLNVKFTYTSYTGGS